MSFNIYLRIDDVKQDLFQTPSSVTEKILAAPTHAEKLAIYQAFLVDRFPSDFGAVQTTHLTPLINKLFGAKSIEWYTI